MAEDPTPLMVDPAGDRAALGALAHRMNNALAYVVANLNLLTEELEQLGVTEAERARILQLVDSATDGADRASHVVRELKVLSWGGSEVEEQDLLPADEDTWDTAGTARILVVDDEPQILAAVSRSLQRYSVTQAKSGRRARELLEQGASFDVILCDVMMHDTNGMELYRWIGRHHPELIERLVFMTAGAFTREVRQFLSSVPNTVLHKPFDTKTLRWMVAQKVRSE